MEKLSENKFIETRARKLPIYKCLINEDWELAKMATVVVMRQHITGNITFGFYLVDLLCLGVKDTGFKFNVAEIEVAEMFNNKGGFIEINYNLAHNIVFAGLEFADGFDIPAHKDFKLTKFILQEDNEDVPLVDIATGDENGDPHLIVSKSGFEKKYFSNIEKHAGNNYSWENAGDMDEEEEDENADSNDFNEDYENLDSFEIDTLTPYDAFFINTDDLLDTEKVNTRGVLEVLTLSVELMMRIISNDAKNNVLSEDEMIETPEFKLTQIASEDINNTDGLISVSELDKDEIILNEWRRIKNLKEDNLLKGYSDFMEKYEKNILVLLLVYCDTLITDQDITEIKKNVCDKLLQLIHLYPLAQLILAYENTFTIIPDIRYSKILYTKDIQNAFPEIKLFGENELEIFWLIKLNQSIKENKLADSIFYYKLAAETNSEKNAMFLQTQIKFLNYLELNLKGKFPLA